MSTLLKNLKRDLKKKLNEDDNLRGLFEKCEIIALKFENTGEFKLDSESSLVYFNGEIRGKIIEHLNNAKFFIWINVYCFTDEVLLKVLERKKTKCRCASND